METYDIYNLAIDLYLGVNTSVRNLRASKAYALNDRVLRCYHYRIVILVCSNGYIFVSVACCQLNPTSRLEVLGLTLLDRKSVV